MSVWLMIGDECICPLRAKHSNWCGLASIVQAIVETFPNNCAIMYLPALMAEAPFSSTFRLASSQDEDDNDGSFSHGSGLQRFGSGQWAQWHWWSPPFSSTPLPHRGHLILASDWKGAPSSSLGAPPGNNDMAYRQRTGSWTCS